MTIAPDFFSPSAKLLTTVTNPNTNQPSVAFPLQTKAWLKMQDVVRSALAFPLTQQDFTNLYGDFADEAQVEAALTVLAAINETAQDYGDPTTLISEIAQFANANSAPDSIYGNAVWLAAQTQTAAEQIEALLSEGLADIADDPTPEQRLQDLTALLTGQGMITDQANGLKELIEAFEKKTTVFYQTLNTELNAPQNSLAAYLAQDDNIYNDAKKAVADEQSLINQLNGQIGELNKEYIGFTVAASVSPLFLLIPFFGIFLAVADATTFGVLASKVKQALDAANAQLSQDEKAEQQKAALVTQIQGFNSQAATVEADGKEFLDAISQLISGWAEFETHIQKRLDALTADDLKDWPAFLQKVNFQAALTGWQNIQQTAQTFFDTGFVNFKSATSAAELFATVDAD